MTTAEHERLQGIADPTVDLFGASPWYEWGPYLSERAWGTVREDYSADGDAWSYLPHDHARSRSYRWNEDGMAGISDIRHELCMALALWNGRDPILKERMFGLTGPQGNHGEDAKDYWWYLDALPSHSWLRWRYHYPQREFPYAELVEENGRRGFGDPEYELLDTGVFDDDRYWVVEVTYAKADPTDIAARITIENRGPDTETLHVLPTLWFRNTWSWGSGDPTPSITVTDGSLAAANGRVAYRLDAAAGPDGRDPVPLFCDNETDSRGLFGDDAGPRFPKNGINDHVVDGADSVRPELTGTKAAFWYQVTVEPGETVELRLRLRADDGTPSQPGWAGTGFDEVISTRAAEADEFYDALAPHLVDDERALVLRQACAGLVWSKQMYIYRVDRWLRGDPGQPLPPPGRDHIRNARWRHMDAYDVLAMPDPWEYPWFAAWDLAFHAIAWAHLDPAFAKYQVLVLMREWFQHPDGALPAYEWNFDDLNPPVHVLAAMRVFNVDGAEDVAFLERAFHKLLLNFSWWLNRIDPDGDGLFGGGFLGFDNISPLDRSHLPSGMRMTQADGTAWMAMYSLGMLLIARRLAEHNPVYDDMVVKFLEHFASIAGALNGGGLFDEEDGFFYDLLIGPDGHGEPVRVQSIAGVIPLLAGATIRADDDARTEQLGKRFRRMQDAGGGRPLTAGHVRTVVGGHDLLVSVVSPDALRRALRTVFDEDEFLSDHGLRSVSRRYAGNPYQVPGVPGAVIDYEPAESRTGMYGGNSNWRGPVWMPVNYLVIQSLQLFHESLGDDFLVEYPSGSGQDRTLREIAEDLSDRLVSIWLPGPDGRRAVHGGVDRFSNDPAWREVLTFSEYFNGDDGAGLGASHQTGWTALVADLLIRPPRFGLPRDAGQVRGRR